MTRAEGIIAEPIAPYSRRLTLFIDHNINFHVQLRATGAVRRELNKNDVAAKWANRLRS